MFHFLFLAVKRLFKAASLRGNFGCNLLRNRAVGRYRALAMRALLESLTWAGLQSPRTSELTAHVRERLDAIIADKNSNNRERNIAKHYWENLRGRTAALRRGIEKCNDWPIELAKRFQKLPSVRSIIRS